MSKVPFIWIAHAWSQCSTLNYPKTQGGENFDVKNDIKCKQKPSNSAQGIVTLCHIYFPGQVWWFGESSSYVKHEKHMAEKISTSKATSNVKESIQSSTKGLVIFVICSLPV